VETVSPGWKPGLLLARPPLLGVMQGGESVARLQLMSHSQTARQLATPSWGALMAKSCAVHVDLGQACSTISRKTFSAGPIVRIPLSKPANEVNHDATHARESVERFRKMGIAMEKK
jgi:hypothetical protein